MNDPTGTGAAAGGLRRRRHRQSAHLVIPVVAERRQHARVLVRGPQRVLPLQRLTLPIAGSSHPMETRLFAIHPIKIVYLTSIQSKSFIRRSM